MREHGLDPIKIRPNGLMLAYPVITSGPSAHRGSIDHLLGDMRKDPRLLDEVSVERHVDSTTPPVFIWHTVTDDCVPVDNAMLFIQSCLAAGVNVEAHLFPRGGHGLSLGTRETAWQGVHGIEPCVQPWPDLFAAWVRRTSRENSESQA
nr:CAZy families CE10 protein [uncultured Clostridium sp.]